MRLRDKLKAIKRKLVPITIGELDGCFCRLWSEREHIEWAVLCQTMAKCDDEDAAEDETIDLYLRCKVIAKSLADADGNLAYESHEEVAELGSDLIDEAYEQICKIQSRKDDAKKNSTEASPSNSP